VNGSNSCWLAGAMLVASAGLLLAEQRAGSRATTTKGERFVVRSAEAGRKLIAGPVYTKNYERALQARPRHRVAVLVPCAAGKPFSTAPSHRFGYLPALQGAAVDVYVVAEPLGIVPWAWENVWPNNVYDFPPRYLTGAGRELLVRRIGAWFTKVGARYDKIVLALPRHHGRLIRDATLGLDVELVDASISACRATQACGLGVHRATTTDYRRYLRRRATDA